MKELRLVNTILIGDKLLGKVFNHPNVEDGTYFTTGKLLYANFNNNIAFDEDGVEYEVFGEKLTSIYGDIRRLS